MPGGVSFLDFLARVLVAHDEEHFLAGPAEVIAYDATSQLATCKPLVMRPIARAPDDPEPFDFEELPEIPSVQVIFPGVAPLYSITFPIAVGTPVFLVVSSFDPSGWRVDGVRSPPGMMQWSYLGGAWAFPGISPLSTTIDPAAATADALVLEAPEIRLTKEASTVDDFIALAKSVDDNFATLMTIFQAISTAPTGDAIPGAVLGAMPPGPLPSTASAKVKAT